MINRMVWQIIAVAMFVVAAIFFTVGVCRADSSAWLDADDNPAIMQEFVNHGEFRVIEVYRI